MSSCRRSSASSLSGPHEFVSSDGDSAAFRVLPGTIDMTQGLLKPGMVAVYLRSRVKRENRLTRGIMVWALWGWVWLGVGLLRGILALLRELRGLYGQQEVETRKKRLLKRSGCLTDMREWRNWQTRWT